MMGSISELTQSNSATISAFDLLADLIPYT